MKTLPACGVKSNAHWLGCGHPLRCPSNQKISLNTPVRVNSPTTKIMAIIHRIIFISSPLPLKNIPLTV
ncbi:hypothetical protein C1N63_12560 [Pantoea ananatis]|nr:hypothetical protein C1N63_12560 [Pantoea ananatis]